MKKIVFTAVVAVCLSAAALFMETRHGPAAQDAGPTQFDAEKWKTLSPWDSGDERLAMALDLMQSNGLAGKTRDGVLAMLGQNCYRDPSGSLNYDLRKTHGENDQNVTSTDDMLILFGPDGRVIEVRHVEWHASGAP